MLEGFRRGVGLSAQPASGTKPHPAGHREPDNPLQARSFSRNPKHKSLNDSDQDLILDPKTSKEHHRHPWKPSARAVRLSLL